MYRIALLFSIISLGTAAAEDFPYDVVTYDTVKKFCEEHDTEFQNWVKKYQYQVKSGAGIIYPKEGTIHDAENKDQKRANMIAFYCKKRHDKGSFLLNADATHLIFQQGASGRSGR